MFVAARIIIKKTQDKILIKNILTDLRLYSLYLVEIQGKTSMICILYLKTRY